MAADNQIAPATSRATAQLPSTQLESWMTSVGAQPLARTSPAWPPVSWAFRDMESLLLGDWPGNLRDVDRLVQELASDQRSGAAAARRPLGVAGLPAWLRAADAEADAGAAADAADSSQPTQERRPAPTREELEAALASLDGSVRAVAKHFGRDRRQIYRWMEAFGLREK